MTRAPDNLLAVRKLLLAHLDVEPTRARSIDLESAEVGIVGDTAHVSQGNSYHLGLPEQSRTGYAATESPRDKAGLCEYASALDVGMFTVTTPRGSYDLRHFSAWCVAQCRNGTADARDIREIIWSPDGRVVRRWDDLGKRTSGDSSHLWHTHFSFYRDATKAGRDLTPLFKRYLTSIGLLEDTVTPADFLAILKNPEVAAEMSRLPWAFKPAELDGKKTAHAIVLQDVPRSLAGLTTSVAGVAGRVDISPEEAQAVAAALAPAIVAALPQGQVTDEQLTRVLRNVLGSLNDAPSS